MKVSNLGLAQLDTVYRQLYKEFSKESSEGKGTCRLHRLSPKFRSGESLTNSHGQGDSPLMNNMNYYYTHLLTFKQDDAYIVFLIESEKIFCPFCFF
jgi:hypothetical protein